MYITDTKLGILGASRPDQRPLNVFGTRHLFSGFMTASFKATFIHLLKF